MPKRRFTFTVRAAARGLARCRTRATFVIVACAYACTSAGAIGCESLFGVDFDRVHVNADAGTAPPGSSSGDAAAFGANRGGGDDASLAPGAPDGGCGASCVPPDATDPTCASPRSCESAETVAGTLLGDARLPPLTVSGTTSRWLRVRVTESDYAFNGTMHLEAELVSPPDANFDLFVYANTASDVVECSMLAGRSELSTPGGPDRVALTWGAGHFNVDDSRTVTIEVRHVGGPCSGAGWSLALGGGGTN